MIDVGSFPCGTCQGVSRRTFLRAGFAAPFALSLADRATLAAVEASKAKSILLIWLGGGRAILIFLTRSPKRRRNIVVPSPPSPLARRASDLPNCCPGLRPGRTSIR